MDNQTDVKRRSYWISTRAFFFLKQAFDLQSLALDDLLIRIVKHVDEVLDRFRLLASESARAGDLPLPFALPFVGPSFPAKARPRNVDLVEVPTCLPVVHHERIDKLAKDQHVSRGVALSVCILLYLDDDTRQVTTVQQLTKLGGFPLVSRFPFEPSGDFPVQPAENKTFAAPEKPIELRDRQRVLLDSSLFCGAFLARLDGNFFSKQANRYVTDCLNISYHGSTTSLDICELGDTLLKASFTDGWLQDQALAFQKSPRQAQHSAITKLLQLLANSPVTIIPIECVDLAAAHQLQTPSPLSTRVKLAAYRRMWPNQPVTVLTLTGYEQVPDWVDGIKFTDF